MPSLSTPNDVHLNGARDPDEFRLWREVISKGGSLIL
jgi:hypothetical protein